MLGDPFAERQVDARRVVDEDAQSLFARLLERDQVERRIELGELLLNVVLGGLSCLVRGEKKVGQAHFSIRMGTKKLELSIAR